MRPSAPGPPDGPSEADLWLGASLDLGDIADLILDMSVPKFADGGVVFVPERLVTGEPDDGAGGQLVARRLRNRFVHEDGYDVESDLPAGEVFAFAADSPYAEPLSTGKPAVFGRPDSATLERIRPGARAMLANYTSFLSVPMSARAGPPG